MHHQLTKWVSLSAAALVIIGISVFIYHSRTQLSAKPALATSTPSASSGELVLTQDEPAAPGFSQPIDARAASGAASASSTEPRTPPAGYKEYRNTQYHFSLFYPQDLKVTEYDEGNGAHTTIFEKDYNTGFQIFVSPDGERQVSAVRFKMDEPSGVMESPQQITINGVPATAFFGANDVMGDTREVWFIKNGLLYEVTTYQVLDSWLAEIMKTWAFL
jgi:hypothetical protein